MPQHSLRTYLRREVFIAIGKEQLVTANGLIEQGFAPSSVRQFLSQWRRVGLIESLSAGQYRLTEKGQQLYRDLLEYGERYY